MMDNEYLIKKRIKVLEAIKPICEAFKISNYDYEVDIKNKREVLIIYDIKIGCNCNSIEAVKNELIGFIFLRTWCRHRSLGAFNTQCKNVIKRYWIDGDR